MSGDSVNWKADQIVLGTGYGATISDTDVSHEVPAPDHTEDTPLPPSYSAIEPWKAAIRLPLLTIEEVEDTEDRQKHSNWFYVRVGLWATTGVIILICLAVGAVFTMEYINKSSVDAATPSSSASTPTLRCGTTCNPQRVHFYYYRGSTPVQVAYMLMPL